MRSRALAPPATIALALALTSAGTVSAETVRLAWHAPAECPAQTQFVSEVRARTPSAQLSDSITDGRVFGVIVTRSEGKYSGQLQIQEESGRANTRSFEGDTCAEVVSALALLTALALDPNAPKPTVGDEPLSAVPPSIPPAAITPVQPQPHRDVAASVAPNAQPLPWHMAAGARASMAGWIAPQLLPAVDLFGEVWQQRAGILSPDFRLGLGTAWYSGDAARWQWYLARLEACPLRLPISRILTSQSCIGADVGAVHGTGVDISSPRSSTRVWVAAGLSTGLWLESGSVFTSISAGLMAPITRYRFYFDNPWTELHRIPYVGATAALGAGVRFF